MLPYLKQICSPLLLPVFYYRTNVVWATKIKVPSNQAAPYVYSAVIIHSIGTEQSVIVVHFLQELVRDTKQFQVHVRG